MDDFTDTRCKSLWMSPDGTLIDGGVIEVGNTECVKPVSLVCRLGTKTTGRMLDGQEWLQMPEVTE